MTVTMTDTRPTAGRTAGAAKTIEFGTLSSAFKAGVLRAGSKATVRVEATADQKRWRFLFVARNGRDESWALYETGESDEPVTCSAWFEAGPLAKRIAALGIGIWATAEIGLSGDGFTVKEVPDNGRRTRRKLTVPAERSLQPMHGLKVPDASHAWDNEYVLKVDADRLKWLSAAMSRDDSRPILTAMYACPSGALAATDSYRLHIAEDAVADPPKDGILIAGAAVRRFAAVLKRVESDVYSGMPLSSRRDRFETRIAVSGNSQALRIVSTERPSDNWTVGSHDMLGTFPRYLDFIHDHDNTCKVTVPNGTILAAALRHMSKIPDSEPGAACRMIVDFVDFADEDEPAKATIRFVTAGHFEMDDFRVEVSSTAKECAIADQRDDSDDSRLTAFCPTYMADAVDGIGHRPGTPVELSIVDAARPIVIRPAEACHETAATMALVMPTRAW